MNRLDHQLDRLLQAAARARREIPRGVPFAVEAQALAQWRGGVDTRDDGFVLLPLVRRAFALACVLALIALALSYPKLTQRPSDEVVIINSPVTLSYLP